MSRWVSDHLYGTSARGEEIGGCSRGEQVVGGGEEDREEEEESGNGESLDDGGGDDDGDGKGDE